MSRLVIAPDDRLAALAAAHAAGELTPDLAAELERRCAANPAAMRTYLAYLDLEAELAFPGKRAAAAGIRIASPPTPRRTPRQKPARLNPILLAAALLLAASAFAIVTLALNNRQSPIDNRQSPPQPLASVTDVLDGTLLIDDQIASAGEWYAGRSISLDAGEAEFMLPNRVTVKLRGSTSLTMHDAMSVTMASGSADFDCPPGAKGYAVQLPGGARVVDLGTSFRIDIGESDSCNVRVVDGAVELYERGDAAPRTLRSGFTARLDDDGSLRSLSGDFVYVSPLAGENGNTVDLAAGSALNWSNDPANRGNSRHHSDNLWGSPPLDQGFASMPSRITWESKEGEDCPAIRTTIDGLEPGVYEVALLWAHLPVGRWDIRAKLSDQPAFATIGAQARGDKLATVDDVDLYRTPLGRVTGSTLAVDIDDLPGEGRTRYVGLAYRRIYFESDPPDLNAPPSEPADRSPAPLAVDGPSRHRTFDPPSGD